MAGLQTEPDTRLGEVESHELAQRARSGCAVSFEELARRYRPRLLTVLERRLSGNISDAEDVAQEALSRAWQKIGLYDDKYQFSTWLYTIAFRIATDHHRRDRRRKHDVGLGSSCEPVDPAQFERTVQRKEEANNLWAVAHAVLNEAQYTVMWLRYGEDLEVKEVAKATGRTAVGTRVLLHRARKLLQQHVVPEPMNDKPGGAS